MLGLPAEAVNGSEGGFDAKRICTPASRICKHMLQDLQMSCDHLNPRHLPITRNSETSSGLSLDLLGPPRTPVSLYNPNKKPGTNQEN